MLRSIHMKMFAAFVMVLFMVLPCYGVVLSISQKEGFKEIEYFHYIQVHFKTENEAKIGLNKQELTDFLRLKFKNNFAGIPFKKPPKGYLLDPKINKKLGYMSVYIWSAGQSEYPIAFFIEIKSGRFGDNPYETGIIGYCNKSELAKSIKEAIAELIEDFAIDFFKARGEM